MAAFPIEILLGVYLGLLTGIFPAFVAGLLGFVFRYFTGVSLPGLGVVVLAVAIAGVNGGLMGLVDPSISRSPRLLVALIVVMMLSLYAHSQGDKLGVSLPRRFSLRALRQRTLSADVVEVVGGMGVVTVRPIGPVNDIEGYPPLSPELRTTIAAESWEFPADLPLSVLEARLTERLRTDHDLSEVSVDIDESAKAQIAAAPPLGALSRRIPEDHRAISVSALVPTGMARGESVEVDTGETTVEGTLVDARSDGGANAPLPPDSSPVGSPAPDGGTPEVVAEGPPQPSSAPTTAGGEGRVTVAVPRKNADPLLDADRGRIVVRSRGTRREFELVTLLRRAGKRIRRMTVRAGSSLSGTTPGEARIREKYGVAVLAIRPSAVGDPASGPVRRGRRRTREEDPRRWIFSPSDRDALEPGDELFVVGTREKLAAFERVVA